MHELAVTQSILEIAIRHAEAQKANRITDLYIVMGEWSTMVDDSLQFYWDMISENTIAKGAILHFSRNPVVISCLDCGHSYQPTSRELLCPKCASMKIKVKTGEEFYLESIEIET
jgi:hydrogenase nickel incorporation protein HypA/HybF